MVSPRSLDPVIRERLTALLRRGWTASALAKELGCTGDSVLLWASGRSKPRDMARVLASLNRLRNEVKIPPQDRRGSQGSRRKFEAGTQVTVNEKAPIVHRGRKGVIAHKVPGRWYAVNFEGVEGITLMNSWWLDAG